MSDRMSRLIFDMLKYIETMEVKIDMEIGDCRNLRQLLIDEEMPDIYYDCTNMLRFMGIDYDSTNKY